MKVKVSRKSIKDNFRKVYCLDMSKANTIFYGQSPVYYTAGIYGWNCDVYIIDNDTAVTVGYRPFGDYLPEAVEKDMVKKAERVRESSKYNYAETTRKISAIRANAFSRI